MKICSDNTKKTIKDLHKEYAAQNKKIKELKKQCIENAKKHGNKNLAKFEEENLKRLEKIEEENKKHLEKIESINKDTFDKIENKIKTEIVPAAGGYAEKAVDAAGRRTTPLGIEISDNPYKARIQRICSIMILICKIAKICLLCLGVYQVICICCVAFGVDPKIIDTIQRYNIFVQGMRDFTKIPGVPRLQSSDQMMISHFIMLLVTLGILWVVRQIYGLLLNVATSGSPFTKEAIMALHKICIPLLLLMLWNVPISLCLILFILFISFIFDYGIYLQDRADETLSVQEDVILSFAEITEAKSGQTGQHIKRVSEYTKLLADEMGMSQEKSEELRIASMMHDVGKLLIPSEILDKPGKLTDEEFAIIKKHTEYGEQLLMNAHGAIMDTSRLVAKEHHEKWDGNGYAHMKGEEISLEGRIVAVADVYDALTSRRSYKDAWDDKDAYDEIVRCSGSHFDPAVVKAFIACYPKIQSVRAMYADA